MNKDTCLIYEGEFYKVEWYFDDKGISQAYEYFLKASAVQKRKFLILVKKLADFGTIYDKTKFRNEGDDIFAFSSQERRLSSQMHTIRNQINCLQTKSPLR